MNEEIRDDEIIVDSKTGKFDGVKTTRTRYYMASRVVTYLGLFAFCVSCWVGLILGFLYMLGIFSCH